MKTAVILAGHLRTWEQVKESFKIFMSNIDYDLFVTTYNNQYGYHPHIKEFINFYDETEIEVNENLFENLNLKSLVIDDPNDIKQVYSNSTIHSDMQFENCFCQFYKINNILKNIENFEKENNFKYDFILRTRPDVVYNDISIINDNDVIVTEGNIFPNDWFVLCDRDSFFKISKNIIDEFYTNSFGDSHIELPHKLLYNSIIANGLSIKKQPIIKYIMRANGPQYY